MHKKYIYFMIGMLFLFVSACNHDTNKEAKQNTFSDFKKSNEIISSPTTMHTFNPDDLFIEDFIQSSDRSWTMQDVPIPNADWGLMLHSPKITDNSQTAGYEYKNDELNIQVTKYTIDENMASDERFRSVADHLTENGINGKDYYLQELSLRDDGTINCDATYSAGLYQYKRWDLKRSDYNYGFNQCLIIIENQNLYVFSAIQQNNDITKSTYANSLLYNWHRSFSKADNIVYDDGVIREQDTHWFYDNERIDTIPEKNLRVFENKEGIDHIEYTFSINRSDKEEYKLILSEAGLDRAEWFTAKLYKTNENSPIQVFGVNKAELVFRDMNADGFIDIYYDEASLGEHWIWQAETNSFEYQMQRYSYAVERTLPNDEDVKLIDEDVRTTPIIEEWNVDNNTTLWVEIVRGPIAYAGNIKDQCLYHRINIYDNKERNTPPVDSILLQIYFGSDTSNTLSFDDVDFDQKTELAIYNIEHDTRHFYRWNAENACLDDTGIDLSSGYWNIQYIDAETETIRYRVSHPTFYGEYSIMKWFGNELRIIRSCEYSTTSDDEDTVYYTIFDYPFGKENYKKEIFSGTESIDKFEFIKWF